MNNTCPVCKSSSYHSIGIPQIGEKASKIINEKYLVVQCNICQYYFLDPNVKFTQDKWEYLYNSEYFPKPTKWHLKQRELDRKNRFDNLQNYSSLNIVNFLDVGCGEGYSLLEAYNRGWESYGVDIFDNRLEEIKNKTSHFVKSDLLDASFPDNFFDIIYLDSVLEHVTNPLEYLIEINRILKKGGLVYIGVPNEDSLFNDFRKFVFRFSGRKDISEKIMPFKTPFHIGGFNSFSLDFIVNSIGLIIKVKRNFASRLEFMKYPFLSKSYFLALMFLPIYLIAIPFKREVYYELYLEKK
jgi:SAM-dependent methyltransferase